MSALGPLLKFLSLTLGQSKKNFKRRAYVTNEHIAIDFGYYLEE